MKVILLKDVPKLGKKYDIKEVAEGHALNLLIPRGLVILATPQEIQKLNQKKAKDQTEMKIQGELLVKSLDTIRNTVVTIKGKANEKGHLFAGISKDVLIAEIFKQAHINLDAESVNLPKPIKELGEHKVKVEASGKGAELTVVIEAE